MRLSPRTLRTFVLTPVLAAAAAFTAHSASAEVTFKVPFAFTAADRALPAGEYRLTHDDQMNTVTLVNPENKNVAQWFVGPRDLAHKSTGAQMSFDPLSNGFALRSIQYHGSVTARLDKHLRGSDDRRVHVIRGE